MKRSRFYVFAGAFAVFALLIAIHLGWRSVPLTRPRGLTLVTSMPSSSHSPIELSSAQLSRSGTEMLLTFTPDVRPFDIEEIAVELEFLDDTPSGWRTTTFRPVSDWSLWKIPILGDKPRRLRLTGLGRFDRLVVKLSYKGTCIGDWTYACR
jgi:hypothetical protein